MNRRDLLKLGGLRKSLVLRAHDHQQGRPSRARDLGGPYFLHMHAGGGWDPTILCDAKLTAPGATPAYENRRVTAVAATNGIVVPTETANGKFLLRSNNNPIEDPQKTSLQRLAATSSFSTGSTRRPTTTTPGSRASRAATMTSNSQPSPRCSLAKLSRP
jgi:hypothetical protein